jgi:hypothetical protein
VRCYPYRYPSAPGAKCNTSKFAYFIGRGGGI